MLNKQKTSTFLIKKIKWEIYPKQNKRSLKKKKVKKKLEATATTAATRKNGRKEVSFKIQI